MRTLFLFVFAVLALSACRGTDNSPPATNRPETATVESPVQSTGTSSVDRDWHVGSKITSSDVTASIPADRDGRSLSVAGALGDEIMLKAERPVTPLPGEMIGQGPNSYDQLFLAWNPASGALRDLWQNVSTKNESVMDGDGDWILSLLYRNNPQSSWILRLRNAMTGEIRDIDQESPARKGLEGALSPQIDAGRVVYVRLSGEGSLRTSEVVVYDIATEHRESVVQREYTLEGGGASIGASSIDGDRVAWTEQDGATALPLTVVKNLATRETKSIKNEQLGICQLVRGTEFLACGPSTRLLGSSNSATPKTLLYDLSDGSLTQLSGTASPGFHSWNGWLWVPAGNGTGARAILHNAIDHRQWSLAEPNTAATARLVDGWFTWSDFVEDSDGHRDWAAGAVHAIKLD